jgi:ketosteroid isomerase-like protein
MLMSLYAPDVVYFDVAPPRQFAGAAAGRDLFTRRFDAWDGPVGLEVREMTITVGTEIALAHWFCNVTRPLKNGRRAGSWVRVTTCCRWSGDRVLITHEHVSLPDDVATGSATWTWCRDVPATRRRLRSTAHPPAEGHRHGPPASSRTPRLLKASIRPATARFLTSW